MKEGKQGNFIEEMKKRLNSYHIQRIRKIEEKDQYKELFKQENQAKDILMQMGDVSELFDEHDDAGFGEITGWLNQKTSRVKDNSQLPSQRRVFSSTKNSIQSVPSRNLGNNENFLIKNKDPSMINYLKDLLVRLESPPAKKRDMEKKIRTDEPRKKLKTQETLAQLRRSKPNIEAQPPPLNEKKNMRSAQKPERAKFETIDLNSENRPVLHSARPNVDYQKIKRKSQNQYDIDIAYEKDILQQLIKGTKNERNTQNYFSTKSQKSSEKFTLKNLLY